MTVMIDSRVETVNKLASYHPGSERFVLVGLAGPAAGIEYGVDKPKTIIGRSTTADICLTDDQVSRRHVELTLVPDPIQAGRALVVVQDLQSRNGVRVNGRPISKTLLDGGEKVLIGRSVFRLDRRDDFDLAHGARQRALTLADPLTGLGNRSALQEMLEQSEAARRADARPYAVLVLDLDHFKSVNDRFGHDGGDAALRHVATVIRSCVRPGDGAFRLGGEEFVVVLPGASSSEAAGVAERVRARLEETTAEHQGQTIHVTASIGVAVGAPLAFSAADRALYDAKRAGRNTVREAPPIAC